MPSLGSLPSPLPNRRRWSDILVGMPPRLNNLRCHSGSNEGDAELFGFLRHMQTPVSSVGTNREKEGVWCFSANRNTVWALVHGHRRERLARGYFDLGSSKRDLHSLTPPCDREPTRVVLRHPHNSRPLRHALLPERWFVYTPPCLFCDLISNKPTSCCNTSLNMCWCHFEARQGLSARRSKTTFMHLR